MTHENHALRSKVLVLDRLFDPPTELEQARQNRQKALDAVSDAKSRGDCRDLHHAQREARKATTAELRLVLGGRR